MYRVRLTVEKLIEMSNKWRKKPRVSDYIDITINDGVFPFKYTDDAKIQLKNYLYHQAKSAIEEAARIEEGEHEGGTQRTVTGSIFKRAIQRENAFKKRKNVFAVVALDLVLQASIFVADHYFEEIMKKEAAGLIMLAICASVCTCLYLKINWEHS